MPPTEAIPVILLTGFLGSGKTTFLSRALASAQAAETLLLVNEIGEVGLDHDLLWQGGDVPLLLENGCVCCTVGDDLLTTLEELFWARLHRRIPRFARVLIETTGLADPRPIIAALRARPLVAERYRYGGTVTVVDASMPPEVMRGAEALAQIAVADRVILSKTDLATEASCAGAAERIAAINPLAPIEKSAAGGAGAALFSIGTPLAKDLAPDDRVHHHGHGAMTLTLDLAPVADMGAVEAAMGRLVSLAPRLLRAKGVALVAGAPVLVQAVGGAVSPPEPYAGRPGGKATGRLVVIGRDLDRAELRAALGPLAG
jgi:G3E family GTPase